MNSRIGLKDIIMNIDSNMQGLNQVPLILPLNEVQNWILSADLRDQILEEVTCMKQKFSSLAI